MIKPSDKIASVVEDCGNGKQEDFSAERARGALNDGQSTAVGRVSEIPMHVSSGTRDGKVSDGGKGLQLVDDEPVQKAGEGYNRISNSSCETRQFQFDTSIFEAYPEFKGTSILDNMRKTEYGYLDEQDHVYLDYTGAGLAAKAQHQAHQDRLSKVLYGNPHSDSPTSQVATEHVEATRRHILQHFNASPDEYTAIFTPNASGAARLVGESYQFKRGKRLVLTSDNHNSVNGLREFATRRHASVKYVHARAPDLRVRNQDLKKALKKSIRGSAGLFAYPAQSNFSGVRHPLEWISLAQQRGYHVLLDAAAYLPTSALDLSPTSTLHPDFIIASFYKLFGYPTGIGCLISRHESLAQLKRPWFSGGTVQAVSVGLPWHIMALGERAFEDGTLNFLSIPDVAVGLDWLASIGMDVITTRVKCLTGWFIDRLLELRHSDGGPMIRIYGPTDTTMRGGIVAFNFLDADGKVVDERLVARESAEARISLRTGCFCNPGCGEDAFGLDQKKLRALMRHSKEITSLSSYIRLLGLPSAGAIRVSFGIASTPKDIDRFVTWAKTAYRDRITSSEGLPEHKGC